MALSKLDRQRQEVNQLLGITGISEAEKKRWEILIPRMLPSELLALRINLLEQLVSDSQKETIDEIKEGKHESVDDEGLLELVLAKVLQKADQVEERTRVAISG